MSEKENRFDGLMGAVRKKNVQTSKNPDVRAAQTSSTSSDVQASENSNTSTSKHSDIQTSKIAKSANPNYMRTTVYLPKKMHKKLKAIALEEEKEMSSIVEELIEAWLNSQSWGKAKETVT